MIDIETGAHNQFLEWLASISRLGKRKDRLKEKKKFTRAQPNFRCANALYQYKKGNMLLQTPSQTANFGNGWSHNFFS